MKKITKNTGLYLILDRNFMQNFKEMAAYAVSKKIEFLQYRDKISDDTTFRRNALQILEITYRSKTNLILNDRSKIAKEINSDGVHIGQKDESYQAVRELLPNKIIGISTHNLEQALAAEKRGADYIGIGPIFSTSTKEKPDPVLGLEQLERIASKIQIPKVAIGGLNMDTCIPVLKRGANYCAIISAILTAKNPKNEIDIILNKINKLNQGEI